MNTKIKSIISMILTAVMIFSFTTVGFASNENIDSAIPSVLNGMLGMVGFNADGETDILAEDGNTDNDIDTDTDTDIEESDEPEDPNAIVASFSIMSCIYFWPISGHTWLYVENLSDEPIQVGLYEVPVGEGVSIGSFAFTSRDGWGLYYNLEAFRENNSQNSGKHWSITQYLNKAQLKEVSDDIAGYVNYWDFYFNCAFFTFSIWNANSKNFFIPLVIPAISQMELRIAGAEKGVKEMYYPRRDQVFRQKGSKSNARLVPASDKTLDY